MKRLSGIHSITLVLSTLLFLISFNTSATEVVTYYHNDALGSPVAATDEQGNVIWREEYEPYGKRLNVEEASKENEQFYTGKQEEAELGLQYFGARWYDPSIGRFISMDPVGFDEKNIHSFNRYAYANNNPYRYVDPDGRSPRLYNQKDLSDVLGSTSLVKPRVYMPNNAYHGPKPSYTVNPAHLPAGGGKTKNPNKSVLPSDAEKIYTKSVPDHKNLYKSGDYKDQPKKWWGKNKDGQYYQYNHGNDGTAHYAGTIKGTKVPPHVKKRLDGSPSYSGGGGGGGKRLPHQQSSLDNLVY